MFVYSYCYVCSVQGILFYCVVLCIVCVYTSTVLLPPGVKPTAVNKYIVMSFHMSSSMKYRPSAARSPRTCSQVIKRVWSEHSDGDNHMTLTWNCKFLARVIYMFHSSTYVQRSTVLLVKLTVPQEFKKFPSSMKPDVHYEFTRPCHWSIPPSYKNMTHCNTKNILCTRSVC